ncbi:unnamed protein product [Staurois parvus]|uniref:Uncharacterized protein n=1 Tax=Staurois parvus TaxID=386267 RepID=A0ABN9BND1_9NEOB|nr:unnamed protein product [Staurois parvus]
MPSGLGPEFPVYLATILE